MAEKKKLDIKLLLTSAIKNVKEGFEKVWQKIKTFDIKKIDLKKIDPRKIDFKKILTKIKEIDRKKIKKNFVWIILGILVFVFVLARTAGKVKEMVFGAKKEKKAMVEFVEATPVKAYKAKRMDFKDTLPAMGRIEGFREIDLRFDSKGILESFNFEEGERILEGDIIASVDQKDALLKLKYAGLELEKTNIYAPSDGYLGSKEITIGAFVTSQDKIGTFVDFSRVYAAFDVIEEDSPKMKLGQNAEVFLDAYPGVSSTGTVDMVSPMIEGRTRTQKIKIELDNEKGEMKPGMFARAIINTYEKKDALVIPASAFKKQENKYFIYVLHEEEVAPAEEEKGEGQKAKTEKAKTEKAKDKKAKGKKGEAEETPAEEEAESASQTAVVEIREIEIAYLTHDVAEIGKGLKEGELIIREIHQEFKDKDKVEVTEVQETIF